MWEFCATSWDGYKASAKLWDLINWSAHTAVYMFFLLRYSCWLATFIEWSVVVMGQVISYSTCIFIKVEAISIPVLPPLSIWAGMLVCCRLLQFIWVGEPQYLDFRLCKPLPTRESPLILYRPSSGQLTTLVTSLQLPEKGSKAVARL